jgi:hypothetical protein
MLSRHLTGAGSGLTVNWGPWAGSGMADKSALRQRFARQGLGLLEIVDGFACLQTIIGQRQAQTMVARVDWPVFGKQSGNAVRPSLLRGLLDESPSEAPEAVAALCTIDDLAALDCQAACTVINRTLGQMIGRALKIDAAVEFADEKRFGDTRLAALGIDSLTAMEVRNQVRGWVGVDLPAHLLIGGNRVGEVVDLIYQKVLLRCLSQSEPGEHNESQQIEDNVEVLVI